MGTRATVVFVEFDKGISFYKHFDGYQEDVLKGLVTTLGGDLDLDTIKATVPSDYRLECEGEVRDSPLTFLTTLHGDLSYLYIVDLRHHVIGVYDRAFRVPGEKDTYGLSGEFEMYGKGAIDHCDDYGDELDEVVASLDSLGFSFLGGSDGG